MRSGKGRSRVSAVAVAPRRSFGVGAALLILRLYAAAFFLDTALYKLVDYPRAQQPPLSLPETIDHFRVSDYEPTVQGAIDFPPEPLGVRLTAFSDFLRAVMLPHADCFAPAILFGEALIGISLLLGALVRLSAALGFLMMLAFSLAKFIPGGAGPEHPHFLTVHSANWPLTLILLALSLAAAGRVLGIDAWLRRSGPRWLRWAA